MNYRHREVVGGVGRVVKLIAAILNLGLQVDEM